MLKVYLARSMSGRNMAEVVKEAKLQRRLLRQWGITPLDPVGEEKVKPLNKPLKATYNKMVKYWRRDKQMIREAHVVFDMTPSMKSEGVAHEIGYARYCLWKPIVRVYPTISDLPPKSSIAYFEDDVITAGITHASHVAYIQWGTWTKRTIWRIKLFKRCFLKFVIFQIKEWF
jgi:hypothetical protein